MSDDDRARAPFERRRLVIEAGAERATDAGEWADALVIVRDGMVEVICEAGGSRTFGPGDVLCLAWVPVRRLRNPGSVATQLIAVRRRRSRMEAML